MSEAEQEPITGTWDFFTDACQIMRDSGQPYIMLAAQDGSGWCHRQHGIKTLNGVAWFRQKVNDYLDGIEAALKDQD